MRTLCARQVSGLLMTAAENSPDGEPSKGDGLSLTSVGSVPCNGQYLKRLRESRGWTQAKLAALSGFARRTIVKAEAGQSIDAHTLEVLAQTLCEGGAKVSATDLSSDPASLVRRFLKNYATHQADCVQHCLDIISPDIVAVVDGDPVANPIAGTYRGIEEFDGFWRKFFAMFARAGGTLGETPNVLCLGREVIVWGHEYIHLPEVAPEMAGFVMLRILFENGKMIRFEDYYESTGMMNRIHQHLDQFPDAAWARIVREHASKNSADSPNGTARTRQGSIGPAIPP